MQNNAYSAEYGGGVGVENFHFKSGTNQFHGDAYDFLRNNALDSRGFFAPSVSINKQNEFGVTAGGPVYIPHVYNGRNKTFWFTSLTWFRFRGAIRTSLISVPTDAMKNGDFSQLKDANGNLILIFDPATTRPDGHGGLTRDPFPGNIIPPNRISTLSKAFIPLMPTATLPGVVNNALVSVPTAPQNYRQYLMKFDHNFSSKVVLHGSYYRNHLNFPTSPVLPGPLGGGNNFNVDAWEPRLSLDQNLSNNLLNQLAFSVQYTEGKRIFFPHVTTAPNSLATVGLPYPAFVVSGMPTFGVGANDNQISGGCWPCVYLGENLKWIKGRHQLSLGAELRWEDELDSFASNIGTY